MEEKESGESVQQEEKPLEQPATTESGILPTILPFNNKFQFQFIIILFINLNCR